MLQVAQIESERVAQIEQDCLAQINRNKHILRLVSTCLSFDILFLLTSLDIEVGDFPSVYAMSDSGIASQIPSSITSRSSFVR